jgi:hypothetical protein
VQLKAAQPTIEALGVELAGASQRHVEIDLLPTSSIGHGGAIPDLFLSCFGTALPDLCLVDALQIIHDPAHREKRLRYLFVSSEFAIGWAATI